MIAPATLRRLRAALLRWYARERRDLPWRATRDPWAVWVSEVMLQQTRVETVIPYYYRFLARFPDPGALARATEEEALGLWSGLGYYRRARALQAGARAVLERHGGRVPSDPTALRALPGVGRYTAGAIASIAFDLAEPVVDGNVLRVLSRVLRIRAPHTTAAQRRVWDVATQLARGRTPGDLNQALMELGALVCQPRAPRCDVCPIATSCGARASGRPEDYPAARAARTVENVRVGVAWIVGPRGVLVERRAGTSPLRGLWDLPAVELAGRRAEACDVVASMLAERHRVAVSDGAVVARLTHGIMHRRLALEVVTCTLPRAPRTGDDLRWIPLVELPQAPVSGATQKIARAVAALTARSPFSSSASRACRAALLPALILVLLATLVPDLHAAKPRDLALHPVHLDLPGTPSAIVPCDLNGDGLGDLLVVVAYTEWGEVGEDRIEGMVQIVEVVPALFDRREVRAWLGDGAGGFRPVSEPLPLPLSVLSVEPARGRHEALALTDEGVSVFRVHESEGRAELALEPVLREVPAFAGAGSLLAGLRIASDLDGDGLDDLLLPSIDGPSVWRWDGGGYGQAPVARLKLPGDGMGTGAAASRTYPLPQIGDLDGDRIPDLAVARDSSSSFHVLRGTGGGRFSEARRISLRCLAESAASARDEPAGSGQEQEKRERGGKKGRGSREARPQGPELNFLGDLDGAGAAELVLSRSLDRGEGLREAREPRSVLTFHRLRADLSIEPDPYTQLEIRGYPFSGQWPEFSSSGFQDLDGDGRKDLVTITLDFSIFQVLRVLATKSVSVGVDFHVWNQAEDGTFHEVQGLDLSEKLRFDLNDLKLSRFAQFQGDFDGDGRTDFVHLGRGSKVTIHRGQPGCRYAAVPDLTVDLGEEPSNLALVRIADLDGDGRADLAVTRPLPQRDEGPTDPSRVDLYLSGAGR